MLSYFKLFNHNGGVDGAAREWFRVWGHAMMIMMMMLPRPCPPSECDGARIWSYKLRSYKHAPTLHDYKDKSPTSPEVKIKLAKLYLQLACALHGERYCKNCCESIGPTVSYGLRPPTVVLSLLLLALFPRMARVTISGMEGKKGSSLSVSTTSMRR